MFRILCSHWDLWSRFSFPWPCFSEIIGQDDVYLVINFYVLVFSIWTIHILRFASIPNLLNYEVCRDTTPMISHHIKGKCLLLCFRTFYQKVQCPLLGLSRRFVFIGDLMLMIQLWLWKKVITPDNHVMKVLCFINTLYYN